MDSEYLQLKILLAGESFKIITTKPKKGKHTHRDKTKTNKEINKRKTKYVG